METEPLGTTIDWVVIVLYFFIILGFGALFGRYARSTQDFFFAGLEVHRDEGSSAALSILGVTRRRYATPPPPPMPPG